MKSNHSKEFKTSRTWEIIELEGGFCPELEIEVRYTGEANVVKGVTLDRQIIPLFKSAPELLEALKEARRTLEFCAEAFRQRNLGDSEDIALDGIQAICNAIKLAKNRF